MSDLFARHLRASRMTLTQNAALTHATTGSNVLDFFSRAGGMRGQDSLITGLFEAALLTDRTLALRALAHLRDVRGGAGERSLFRTILVWLANNDIDALRRILPHVPFYGRWDDVLPLLETEAKRDVVDMIRNQFLDDYMKVVVGDKPSLLAKWLPSERAASKTTRRYFHLLIQSLDITPRDYRKQVSRVRASLNLVETALTQGEAGTIDYEKVPSQAMLRYGADGKAFRRQDPERFASYLEGVASGKKEIKAGTVAPYQLVKAAKNSPEDAAIEAQWQALVDSVDTSKNPLVMADLSGSMFRSYYGGSMTPMDVSMSLALLLASANKGSFADMFFTFSSTAEIQYLTAETLSGKMAQMNFSNWGGSTNLQAAFEQILKIAVRGNLSQDDMPQLLIVVSDMQFDSAGCHRTNFEKLKQDFRSFGYSLPHVVFWNVDAKVQESPVAAHEGNVSLVSGASANVFNSLVKGRFVDPYQTMLDILNGERYQRIA